MSTEAVSISNVSLERFEDYQELSASVDGERIWYRLPAELELQARPEAFLAPALFEAMARGVPVEVESGMPVSAQLLRSLPEVQAILHCWNKDLNIVPVHAEASDSYTATDNVACCFTGGIDSSYTYANHRDVITHLMLVEGFVSGRGGPDDWAESVAARQAFAESENKSLIPVNTNVVEFLGERDISIYLTHGGLLCGLGVGLGLKQLLIPASVTYDHLMPWGSHPVLDPLWSTEAMQVVHHGTASSRADKTAHIAKHQYLLDQLQVCWYAGGRNCGDCGKCIRTALALHLLGVQSRSLAPYRDMGQLKLLKNADEQGYPFLAELTEMADAADETAIARRLRRYSRSYRFRQAATELVRELIGTRGRDLIRKLRPQPWHNARGTVHSVSTGPSR